MTSNGENIALNVNEKTVLRKRLEELEVEIHNSWLKDQDKVKEFLELSSILEGIYNKSSIEEYFENQGDFDYFCKRFSPEVINNILKQHMVFGPNGDEVALNVLFYYLRLFYKFMERPQYQTLWESVREIFDMNKSYYKGTVYGSMRNYNEKKILSAEKYNEVKLPRKNEAKLEIQEGMEVDVLIESKRVTGQQLEKKNWVRGKVTRVESEYFVVNVGEDPYPIFMKYNSFEFAPKGTMTKDWEWRSNLKQYETIDCFDRGRWYPATVLFTKEEDTNGLKKIEYRIGFRVYPEYYSNWQEFKKIWPNKDLQKDSQGRIYLGDVENLDEWIASHSKRIQKLHSMIDSDSKSVDSSENENYFIDDMVKFTDENGRKTYIIGRNNGFYYYFALMLNFFCELGGFEKMIKFLSGKGENRPSPDLVHNIFYVLNVSSSLFHREYVIELGQNLYENIFNYLNEMNQNELRNIKKDTFDLILKVLRFYLGITIGPEKRNEIIEKFSITFAIKMIKTQFLEKRITAVKTITDVIKASKDDLQKRSLVLKLIEENQIFYEIYGPNSHIQLINKSKDLLEIMLQEDKLSFGEMEMIWGATKKGDLEGKLTILKTLREVSRSLQPKHIKVLLDNIYNSKSTDLINDEIDLIYELSTHSSQSEETLEKCIKFFTACLLEHKSDEGEKIEILINKIFDITKLNPSFKTSVIDMTLKSLEKNENVNLALKILSKYLKDSDLETDYDLNRLLVDSDNLVNLFRKNFVTYMQYVREKVKNIGTEIRDIDLLPLRDEFNHSQNLKARLNFLNTLLTLKLWKVSEDPIHFVYTTLIEQGALSEKDKNEFFNWIKNAIERNVDFETEQKIFKLFNEKLCNDTKSCQNLSIEAFDTYLKVFLDINSQSGSLTYSKIPRESSFDIDVYVEPEKLIGFQILWKIVFESFSVDIMNKGIETLHSLFTNVQLKFDGEVLDEAQNSESHSQLLLRKCVNLIKSTNESETNTIEEKRNIITKCLTILKLMVEESEKRGTVNIKSHAGILKKKILNIKICASCGFVNLRDFSLKIYANTTIWELKQLITQKLEYNFEFLKIFLSKNNYELKSTDNGKTLLDLNIEDDDEIRCSSNGIEKMIPQAELNKSDNSPTEEVMNIFESWFEKYNTNGKMGKEDCAKFIKAVTNCREEITLDDHRISFLFGTYDRNKDDLLEREEFLQFYIECVVKPEKRKIVWDNMKSMGIRNDLKKMSEPYSVYNNDKTLLPRYQLSHNEEFFNTIFYLQDLNEEIAREAFNFLCIISTNPKIYEQILQSDDKTDWNVLLNESNIYKLIYSLQIIESFLEEIEIKSENVDMLPEGDNKLDSNEKIQNPTDLNERKIQWIQNFVQKGGYSHLVNILQKRLVFLVDSLQKKEVLTNSLMNNICIEFLLKIVRIFYFSSLNKFKTYKKVIDGLHKEKLSHVNVSSFTDDYKNLQREKSGSIDLERKTSVELERKDSYVRRASSQCFDLNSLESYFVSGGLSEFILNSFDHNSLIANLLQLTSNLINKDNKSKQESDIINTSFEFLTVIVPFAPENDMAEKIVLENKNFVSISLYGLLNVSSEIRVTFSSSLIKMCKLLQYSNRFSVLHYLFLNIFELIENISKELEKNSNELFEFFSYLLEIYLDDPNKFKSTSDLNSSVNPKEFLKKIVDNLEADINEDLVTDKVVNLSNELFIGYLKIVTKVAESNLEIKNWISKDYNLIKGVLTKVLFKQNSQELKEKLSMYQFVDPDKIDDSKSNRNSNQQIRNVCYNFILAMLRDSIDNFENFFSVNVLEEKQEKKEEKNDKISKYFSYSNMGRNEGYVGLKNLGCICYMNAMCQQFFMVPSLRYALLKADDKEEPDYSTNPHRVDDNSLHQVQRMFSYLELSDRMDYNPFGFCFSFKDWEGNPTNTSLQQDAQEFLSRFLDVIENKIKPTPLKYVFQSIFGGKTCTQLTCEQGCGSVSNRFEDFYTLSLEVLNMKTLNDSLEKLISPEKIDDYDCSTCKRKVAITKRNLLASLPNVLIVHLQRLFYNYELDRNEKINSRLEFPKILNLKDYCLEEVSRKNAAKKFKEGGENNSNNQQPELENLETDDTYFKQASYYEYHLVGVVVHMGSAEAGHYYSYINTERGGEENVAYFNPKDESHSNSWLEYNDSYISKFNVNKLEDECYGGSYDNDREKSENTWANFNRGGEKTKSAYMLVYERRIKTPIKIVIEPSTIDTTSTNIISYKEEESAKVRKENDLCRYNTDSPTYSEIRDKIFSSIFYDVAKNEYYSLQPYYNKQRLIPQKYYLEIMEDNSVFQKHQNISDERFVSFFDNVINLLDETMSNLKEVKPETSVKISITFMNFIFNILSQKDKQQLLKTAIEKFLHILQNSPTCLAPVWQYISENQKALGDILFNDNENVVQNNVDLIYELIHLAYENNQQEFMQGLLNNDYYSDNENENSIMYLNIKKTIEFILSMFPRVPGRLVAKCGPILKLIRDISLLSEDILQYLSTKEIIFTFITFMLGRESPCYQDTLIKAGDNWDFGRNQISGFEPVVDLIYDIFYRSEENKLRDLEIEPTCHLSIRDVRCLKNPNFLKFIFKNCDRVFSALLLNLNYEDEEFTLQSCVEITKYIDEIYAFNGGDFVKLFYSIIPLLNLKDSLQRTRFEIIMGIPQIMIEESSGKSPFPYIGYHNLSDERSKLIDHKGTINLRNMCSVVKKMYLLKSKDTISVQIFLAILEACTENRELLKYIRKMPAEEPLFESFIEWGVAVINSYGRSEQNVFYEKLKEHVSKINPSLEKVMSDPDILPGFKSFIGRFIMKDIKREEIALIAQKDNLFLFSVEYFGNYLSLNENIDYSHSKSYVGGGSLLEDEEKIKKENNDGEINSNNILEEENLKSEEIPEDTYVIPAESKLNLSEKEFFKIILPRFTDYKKVVVENKGSVPNSMSLLRRYVILNSNFKVLLKLFIFFYY
jgi:ubiquitin C-terminal hydrolase